MSGYLLDTNVISEIVRTDRDSQVVAFLADVEDAYVSTITIHELHFGLERLEPGRRRNALSEALECYLFSYHDRLLPVGEAEARAAAVMRAAARSRGRTPHLADVLIAATALVAGLTVATRNVADFEGLDVALRNPWNE